MRGLFGFLRCFTGEDCAEAQISKEREEARKSERIGEDAVFSGSQKARGVNDNKCTDASTYYLAEAQPEGIFDYRLARVAVLKQQSL